MCDCRHTFYAAPPPDVSLFASVTFLECRSFDLTIFLRRAAVVEGVLETLSIIAAVRGGFHPPSPARAVLKKHIAL